MSEQELEKTILDFLDGESDVLVSTSIIETGVDIPNVNTLIVHDADKMGLSQLYQLRGRVGRSNRIAYAYFTYQRDKVLTEVAEKRLQSIKEFTELGSGFKIAMRDLSIRGAGNLLGAEQHGFIASVGFDLYSQMLAEEIAKRKAEMDGEPVETVKEISTVIDMSIDAYLPSDYIYDSIQKIEIYKKVAAICTPLRKRMTYARSWLTVSAICRNPSIICFPSHGLKYLARYAASSKLAEKVTISPCGSQNGKSSALTARKWISSACNWRTDSSARPARSRILLYN